IFGPEIEDLANLDATGMKALIRRNVSLEAQLVVNGLGRGIKTRPRADVRRQVRLVIDPLAGNGEIEHVPVAETAGPPGIRGNDEFGRELSADGPSFGRHGNGF